MHNFDLLRRLACALPACALFGACTVDPINGRTFTGSNIGRSMNFGGYTDTPNQNIRVQVLNPSAQDPFDPASTWTTIANTTTNNSAIYHNDPDPIYAFSVNATPVSSAAQVARWPDSGLGRLRIQYQSGGTWYNSTTFDDFSCLLDNFSESWKDIGLTCQSHDLGVVTLVDTDVLPVPLNDYISRKATPVGESVDYKNAVNAGPGDTRETFAGWLSANGFGAGPPFVAGPTATATYYNRGDLGLGREMHCKKILGPFLAVTRIACYVTNYGLVDDLIADESSALSDAVARTGSFATVAMEWYPGGAANNVRFFVYDQPAGNIQRNAALDSQGVKRVPGVCLACHGGTYDSATDSVTGAQFLPFDLDSFGYSSAAGFTRADQEEEFRKLNSFVNATSPNAAIAELIDGWYGGAVDTAGTTFDGSFVPSGWSGEETAYKEVVAKYCRMCHVSQTGALAFDNHTDFNTYGALIENAVCGSHDMPHAEVPQAAFWESSARAHLFGGTIGVYPDCN